LVDQFTEPLRGWEKRPRSQRRPTRGRVAQRWAKILELLPEFGKAVSPTARAAALKRCRTRQEWRPSDSGGSGNPPQSESSALNGLSYACVDFLEKGAEEIDDRVEDSGEESKESQAQ